VTGTTDLGKFGAYNDAGAAAPSNCASYSESTITGTVGSRATTGTSWTYGQLTSQTVQDGVLNVGGTYFETTTVDNTPALYPKVYKSGSTTELVPGQSDNLIPPPAYAELSENISEAVNGSYIGYIGDAQTGSIVSYVETLTMVYTFDDFNPATVESTSYTASITTATPFDFTAGNGGALGQGPGEYVVTSVTNQAGTEVGIKDVAGNNMINQSIYIFTDYADATTLPTTDGVGSFEIATPAELQMVNDIMINQNGQTTNPNSGVNYYLGADLDFST
jgi:hypothetical protein